MEPPGGNAFQATPLSNGQSFVFEPNVRGTWQYHCEIHPAQMANAKINVE